VVTGFENYVSWYEKHTQKNGEGIMSDSSRIMHDFFQEIIENESIRIPEKNIFVMNCIDNNKVEDNYFLKITIEQATSFFQNFLLTYKTPDAEYFD